MRRNRNGEDVQGSTRKRRRPERGRKTKEMKGTREQWKLIRREISFTYSGEAIKTTIKIINFSLRRKGQKEKDGNTKAGQEIKRGNQKE